MVYTKQMVIDNVNAALATNPTPAADDMQDEMRAVQDRPEDRIANQNAAFNYLFKIQQTPAFVPDTLLLNTHLSWINNNKASIAAPDLANLLNIVRNIVGSAQHAMSIRLRLQTFKRETMGDYSDSDPIEATLFGIFQELAVANTAAELDALQNQLRSYDSLIPA